MSASLISQCQCGGPNHDPWCPANHNTQTIDGRAPTPTVQCPNCGYQVAMPEGAAFTPCEGGDMERVKQVARNNGSNGQLCPECGHPYCDDCSGIATVNPPRRGCCQCSEIRPIAPQDASIVEPHLQACQIDPAPHSHCGYLKQCSCKCPACQQARETAPQDAPQDIAEIARQADAEAALDTIEAAFGVHDVTTTRYSFERNVDVCVACEQPAILTDSGLRHLNNRVTPLPELADK